MRLRLATASAIALILVNVLLVSNLPSTFSSFSRQPPVDTSTYRSVISNMYSPMRIDPASAYDPAIREILQNVYEPLIFFGDKPLAPEMNAEITDDYVADVENFVSVLATEVPSVANGNISPDGKNWTFTVNTNAVFQPWLNRSGRYEPARNVTVADVVYSFQRQTVYGYRLTWFNYAFGIHGWSSQIYGGPFSTYDNGTFMNPVDETTAGVMIRNWVYPGPGVSQVTFHFKETWPESVLKQAFAQTASSILNKDWVIEHGGWDGQLTPGWTNNYHWKPTKSGSELDVWKDPATYGEKGSKYRSDAPDIPDSCGTGPYVFISWDSETYTLRIDKFSDYWRGWTQAGDKTGNYISKVIVQKIYAKETRNVLFLQGEFDDIRYSPSDYGYPWDLLNQSDPTGHTPVSGVRLYWNLPTQEFVTLSFQFDVSPDSPYLPKNGTTPTPNLFADVHMRRAFAFALNFTQYYEDCLSYYAESVQPASWWLRGMKPDYENKTLIPHNINSTIVEEELKAAGVWEQGFEVKFVNVYESTVLIVLENMLRTFFININPKFNVSLESIRYRENYSEASVPLFFSGSLADFGEPGDFAKTYMHSEGDVAFTQKYNDANVDYLVDLGLSQSDGLEKNATYQELQYIYWRDIPSLPMYQQVDRRWSKEWVKGWYYNPLYSGLYYYDMYKEQPSTPSDGAGQVVDYSVPIIAFGTIVATIIVGSAIYVRHRKKEFPPTKEESSARYVGTAYFRPSLYHLPHCLL